MATEKINLVQLTWLRGLAAFWVVCSHVNRAAEVKYTPHDVPSHNILLSVFDLGTLGVALFFTLSGVTLFLSNRKISIESPFQFYIKRFFRIWPAYFIALVIYIFAGFIFREWYVSDPNLWVAKQFTADYTGLDVVQYSLLTFNFTGPSGLFNNAFWSLPVEFQYYLMFPILILMLGHIGIAGPLIFGAFVYLIYRSGLVNLHSNLVFIFAFTFCSGVCIGSAYKELDFRISLATFSVTSLSILILNVLMVNGIVSLEAYIIIPSEWVFFGISAVALVFLATFTEIKLPLTLEKFLVRYGEISYSTYLYHNLVIGFLVIGMGFFNINDPKLKLAYLFFTTLFITYFFSLISYRFVEQPFIKLGKVVSNNLFS
ncbi:acyltransferase [Marinobacter sp. 1_MG-2023]|uniref:acyltransferase family protein n=1 Tax=Marinobacter sp. 1_MG-2023 TaxID=3062627 RepID=UPI0026E14219|nr:acyltransferase [Marinobacter sp. 1_MG-2023]MDO6824577.1 acyltransferase [Marinobacter sp. 1_MG-2023]